MRTGVNGMDARKRVWEVIEVGQTGDVLSKSVDVFILSLIVFNVVAVVFGSVASIYEDYGPFLDSFEFLSVVIFSIEYVARIITVKRPSKYIFSFYGIIDFLSTIPLYLSFFIVGSQTLITVRALRLLRVFRILKLARYLVASSKLILALKASRIKIAVFLFAVFVLTIILGTIMYLVEGPENGFTSIPLSVYWAIVTLTTVGYGDIAPHTAMGQFIASLVMILGYAIIAIPTGIVTSELTKQMVVNTNTQVCPSCSSEKHKDKAKFCYDCGEKL